MDFNTFLQIVITTLLGGLAWYFKREATDTKSWLMKHEKAIAESRKEFSDEISKARADAAEQIAQAQAVSAAQIAKIGEKSAAEIKRVEQKFENLRADLPLIYTSREDFIRIMNGVEGKLDRLLYARKGGNNHVDE